MLGATQSAPDPSLAGKAGTSLSEGEREPAAQVAGTRGAWDHPVPSLGCPPPVAPVPSPGRACALLKLPRPLVSLFVEPGLPRTALPRRGLALSKIWGGTGRGGKEQPLRVASTARNCLAGVGGWTLVCPVTGTGHLVSVFSG